MHLNHLAGEIKTSLQATTRVVPFRFTTIGVSDGISMGTPGMSYSLPSREIIADSIETLTRAQWYDALVCVPGCDKNMPGALLALLRLNRPAMVVYGGTIRKGKLEATGESLDVVSAFQSFGEYLSGRISEQKRSEIVRCACPGPGACGGMYTANTSTSCASTLRCVS